MFHEANLSIGFEVFVAYEDNINTKLRTHDESMENRDGDATNLLSVFLMLESSIPLASSSLKFE